MRRYSNNRFILILIAFAVGSRLLLFTEYQYLGITLSVISYALLLFVIFVQAARMLNISKRWRRAGRALHTLDLELYSSLRCLYHRYFSSPPKSKVSDRPPILFLHGMLGEGQDGHYLLTKLSEYSPVYSVDMGTDNRMAFEISYEQEIERCAKIAAEKIDQILKKSDKKQIILIGHSRGGIVANYLAATLVNVVVPLVITLGTPLQHPDREDQVAGFINELNQILAEKGKTRFLHLWAEGDLVTAIESSYAKKASFVEWVKIPHVGHLSLLYSDEAVDKIISALLSVK